jgi:hypothetical protein
MACPHQDSWVAGLSRLHIFFLLIYDCIGLGQFEQLKDSKIITNIRIIMAAPTLWSHSYLNIAWKNVLAYQYESIPRSHLVF